MRVDCGLNLGLSQKLTLTPQLYQAITILQLSAWELERMIDRELTENPALEVEDTGSSGEAGETGSSPADRTADYWEWADYFNDNPEPTGPREKIDRPAYEPAAGNVPSLAEHLELQLRLSPVDRRLARIVNYLIGCIDENGYLKNDMGEIAAALGVSRRQVGEALAIIQTFDPAGVGARNLAECLAIQLRQRGQFTELTDRLITGYLPQVADGHLKNIADTLNCPIQDVQQAVDLIRTLNPKPGRAFGGGPAGYIQPDVTVERVNGRYVVIVNDNYVPRLTVNPFYRRLVREADEEARRYVNGRLNAAVWLIKSIEQRRNTLYNVMTAVVDLQQGFFDLGPKYLKPLTMQQVANRAGVHESTVSRAIANKYAETPFGLVNLRTFFPAGVVGSDGQGVAATLVKTVIKELVAGEDPRRPLSDQALTGILKRRNIELSRRTVAKYREEMGIASSNKRKRY